MLPQRRQAIIDNQNSFGRSKKRQLLLQMLPARTLSHLLKGSLFTLIISLLGSLIYIHLLTTDRTLEIMIPPPPSWRFPQYGTERFFDVCPWVSSYSDEAENQRQKMKSVAHPCFTKVHPNPNEYEGLSEWLTKIVSGYIDARLRHCLLLLDYGTSVDLDLVIQHVSIDWRTEHFENLDCRMTRGTGITPGASSSGNTNGQQTTCYSFAKRTSHNILSRQQRELGVSLHPSGIHIPNYRHIFKNLSYWNTTNFYYLYEDQFEDLKHALPGFRLETGFACAMGSSLKLANPYASKFQSNLFHELLPQLRDPNAVVITIYIRSGHSDQAARDEKEECPASTSAETILQHTFEPFPALEDTLACVHKLERLALLQQGLTSDASDDESSSSSATLPSFPPKRSRTAIRRLVWLLITDSVPLKAWARDKYDQKTIVFNQSDALDSGNPQDDFPSNRRAMTNRIVLTTSSRGIHTRASRNPQTADFGEAMVDWFLMGEADAVVTSSRVHTFGTSAALRTATPIFDGTDCMRLKVVQDGPSPNKQQKPYVPSTA